jgi:hypothetical protein
MNFIATLKTDSATYFTGAIVQNAVAYADIPLPGALEGIGGRARVRLKMISIISKEALDWELMLFNKDTHATSSVDTDSFCGRWSFVSAMAVRIAGAGLYYYYIDGLDVPYTDADGTGELHLGLINRSAASKTAGANGAISVSLTFEELGA